jgi:hypothetical protein
MLGKKQPKTIPSQVCFIEGTLVNGVAMNNAHLLNAKRNPSATLALRSG